jgi:hypothetical protein
MLLLEYPNREDSPLLSSRFRPMSYLRLILRGVLCLAISLCVLEVCARIDDALTDGAPFFGAYNLEAILTYDQYGMTGKPYAHYRQWTLNSLGYRGPEFRSDREPILCIGASETFGIAESHDMEYPRQLEREMNARVGCDRFQVLNISHPGKTLPNFTRRIDKLAADFRPRVAVIYPSPIFYFYPSFDDDEVAHLKQASAFEPRIRAKIFNLLDTLPEWTLKMRYEHHIRAATRHATLVKSIPKSDVERFHQDLSELIDRLEKNHIQPVLVTHATRFGKRVLSEDSLAFLAWRNTMPILDESGFLDIENRTNDVMRKESAARNIPLVEAADRLSGRENFFDRVHFTDRGAHAMANLIAGKLLESDETRMAGCSRNYIAGTGDPKCSRLETTDSSRAPGQLLEVTELLRVNF